MAAGHVAGREHFPKVAQNFVVGEATASQLADFLADAGEREDEDHHAVGEDEADPATGHIAWTSPLASALLEVEPGEVVPFSAGGRDEEIEVLAIASLL